MSSVITMTAPTATTLTSYNATVAAGGSALTLAELGCSAKDGGLVSNCQRWDQTSGGFVYVAATHYLGLMAQLLMPVTGGYAPVPYGQYGMSSMFSNEPNKAGTAYATSVVKPFLEGDSLDLSAPMLFQITVLVNDKYQRVAGSFTAEPSTDGSYKPMVQLSTTVAKAVAAPTDPDTKVGNIRFYLPTTHVDGNRISQVATITLKGPEGYAWLTSMPKAKLNKLVARMHFNSKIKGYLDNDGSAVAVKRS
jgi:hypothetical protein